MVFKKNRLRPRTCPQCGPRLLEPIHEHGVEIDACTACGGLWFDAGELAKAIRDHDPDAVPTERVFDSLGEGVGPTTRACPSCQVPLIEHALSSVNPLRVDVCERCAGVWLDRDELATAQASHQLPDAVQAIERNMTWGHWFFQLLTSLPVEFNIQPRRLPFVTYALIAINCLVFLAFLADPEPFTRFALYPDQIGRASWWTALFTSQFIHVHLLHLVGNLYFLWLLGDNLEDLLGPAWFLAFFFSAAVAGDIAFSLLAANPSDPAVGASGAVSGLLAAYAVYFRGSRLTFMLLVFQFKLPAWAYVGIWALLNLLGWMAGLSDVAWEAHAGGFVFGLLIAITTYRPLLRSRPLLRLLNGQFSSSG